MCIEEKFKAYINAGVKRWHTPGHKGALCPLDLTEIGHDGDIFPAESIELAQEKAAKFFGSKHCRFLVNGSSGGIKAAIMSAGGDIIAPTARHRCVDEGAALARISVQTLECGVLPDGRYAPPSPNDVIASLDKYPDVEAVLIVSPDYYGVTVLREIADIVHERGKLLIADSAHGAHFKIRPDLFGHGFSDIADCCIMSAHKTMHAYTQSAYLCVNNEDLLDKVDENLKLLGTTSPSYLLLAGLENAIDYAERNRGKYDSLKAAIDRFRKDIVCRRSDDFTRVVVDAAAYGMKGKEMFEALYSVGHAAEMFDERYVVFIVTLDDDERDIENLRESIKRLTRE